MQSNRALPYFLVLPLFAVACQAHNAALSDHISPCSKVEAGKAGVKACREALRRNPNDPTVHTRLAASLVAVAKHKEALTELQHALRIDPHNFEAHYGAGLVLGVMGNHSESLLYFEHAANIDPDHASTHWHLGTALRHLGRHEEALVAFREAARRDPKAASSWSWMAICAAELKRHAEAVSYWQRALALDVTYFDMAQPAERAMFEESLKIAGIQPAAPMLENSNSGSSPPSSARGVNSVPRTP